MLERRLEPLELLIAEAPCPCDISPARSRIGYLSDDVARLRLWDPEQVGHFEGCREACSKSARRCAALDDAA
jgi:hypothetical protein